MLGHAPHGFLSYGRDGRMYAILARASRRRPADPENIAAGEAVELFNSLVSYAGTFTIHGNTVIHHVDISWNESWTGTDQVRHFTMEGDRLSISTDPAANGVDGEMIVWEVEWQKVR